MKIPQSLFEEMEDYDNRELNEYDWQEQLEQTVRDYNYQHATTFDPYKAFLEYKHLLNQQDQ